LKRKKFILMGLIAALVLGLLAYFLLGRGGGGDRDLLSIEGTGSQVTLHFSPGSEAPVYHAAELLGDQRLGYIGAARENLSFLGKSVIKIWMEGVEADDELFARLGPCEEVPLSAGKVPVYTLTNGTRVLVTEPVAEDVLLVYLGLDKVWDQVEMAWDGDRDNLMFRFTNES